MVSEPFPSWKCGPHIRGRVCPVGGWIVVTQKRVLHFMESHIATSPRIETWLWYHLSCPALVCMILFFLGGPKALLVPQGFVLLQVALGKKPYTQQGRAFLISTSPCASLGNVGFYEMQDSLLGHYNPPPLRANAFSCVGPTLLARAWLWYHLSCPAPMCMILSSLGDPKALLVP